MKTRGRIGFASTAAGFMALAMTPSAGAAAPPPMEAFGYLPAMAQPAISPDGGKLAVLMPVEGERAVVTFDMTNKMALIGGVRPPEDARVIDIDWATEDRLLVKLFSATRMQGRGYLTESARLFAVDPDGENPLMLMDDEIQDWAEAGYKLYDAGTVMSMVEDDPDWIVMRFNGDIYRANVKQDRNVLIEENRGAQFGKDTDFLVDRDGEVRVRVDEEDLDLRYRFRRKGDRSWRDVPELAGDALSGVRFDFIGFSEDPNLIYMIGPGQTGARALYSLDLETGERAVVHANDRRDVEAVNLDRSGRLRAVYFTGTRDIDETAFFDADYEQELRLISKTLKRSHLAIANESRDGRWLMIEASGPSTPPNFYLYDRDNRKFILVGEAYPELTPAALGPRTAFTYEARDGLKIEAFLTLPAGKTADDGPFPLIVYAHGGPTGRDGVDFDDRAHALASRGFAVVQPNFRGSTGYGDAFMKAGFGEWAGAMQDDLADAALHLVERGVADRDRIGIMGWSYGGYAAAMSMVKHNDVFRAAVAGAGVYDLNDMMSFARKQGSDDYWSRQWRTREGDDLKAMSPAYGLERINGPLLIVHGEEDTVVPFDQGRNFAKRAEKAGLDVETLWFEDGDHDRTSEKNRVAWLKASAAFFEEHLLNAPAGEAMARAGR